MDYEIRDLSLRSKEQETTNEFKTLNIYPDFSSPDSAAMQNDFENEFFKQLVYDTVDFIQTPPPKDITIRCKIIVIKGIFNEYLFYVEDTSNGYLLLKTVRKKSFKQFYYSFNIANTDAPYKFGTLYSDFSRNTFVLTGMYTHLL